MSDVVSTVVEAKKSRVLSTVFDNNSGCDVKNGIMKLIGKKDGFDFTLLSVVSTDETIGNMVKLSIDFTDKYNRAVEYGIGEKLLNKYNTKFAKYENMEISTDPAGKQSLNFNYPNTEFITSARVAVKFEKKVGVITRTLKAIDSYVEKLIGNKIERQRVAAEKKAAKAALEKEAASQIPGAVAAPVASDSITGA